MERRGHKRKNNHVVIVTSDATDVKMRQFRVRPWILQTIIAFQCAIIGALIGFFLYEKDAWARDLQRAEEENATIAALEEERDGLHSQIAGLNDEVADLNEKVRILSDTLTQKAQSESELAERLEKQALPTEFPLTGKTNMENTVDAGGNPVCVFTASNGSMVVATANGTVIVVNEDSEYGNNIWVDHGNGYVTIYRADGEVKVRQGETVTRGATLFLITGDNGRLGYQMMRDSTYIDPMEVLVISG